MSGNRPLFVIGLLVGLLAPILAGEAYIRIQPPETLQQFLGDDSSLTGIYRPDPVLGADYQSIDVYRPFEAPRFAEIKPLNPADPTWLFFGNSFARGLSNSVRVALLSHRIYFFRESKDEFHLRIAQARLLLENGLRPERMFFTLIPVEVARYALRPLSWVYVNRNGAINYRFRMPGAPWNHVLNHSWLTRVAWVRSRLHNADPTFRLSSITEAIPQSVSDDFSRLFGALGELSRKYNVPVTVVLLPDRRQILGASEFVLQRTMSELIRQAGLDVFDASEPFLLYSNKRAMYQPDWHYTPVGDRLLLDALFAHLERSGAGSRVSRRENSP